jgi:hypothetical protein
MQEPEQFSTSQVFGAAWRSGATSGLIELASREVLPDEKDLNPNYNFADDVADEFLNPVDIKHFVNSMSRQETLKLNDQLRMEHRDTAIIQQRPWAFFGASMLTDPVAMFLPSIKGGSAMKAGYAAAVAAKTAQSGIGLAAKAAGKTALATGATAALQSIGIEAIQQNVKINKSLADSTFDVVGSAILGTVLGGVGGGIASATGYKAAASHINNSLAGIPDTPGMQPNSKVFVMGPVEFQVHASNETVAATPKWVRDSMKFSDMNQLMESPFQTSNYAANAIFSHGFTLKKNIEAGIPTSLNVEDAIFKGMRKYESGILGFDKIYREQLGVTGDFASGLKARFAEARGKGALNRQQFHIEVAQSLDSNIKSQHDSVNKAVESLRKNITNPIKKELVDNNLLHPKFLDPKFDAYFHRMWKSNVIAKDPNGFEKLTREFFKESNQWYADNDVRVKELNAPVLETRAEIEKARETISQLNSKRKGKLNKPLSKKDQAKYKQSIDLLKELKARLINELADLYDFIPAKYIPHDGHVPSIKGDAEIGASAKKTLMRLLGTDIEQQMNPFVRGVGGADPLEARVFQIPNDFSTTIIDSDGTLRTINAWDFVEKDIHRVFSNYIRRTVPPIETQKTANKLGFETFSDFHKGLLESLQDDFMVAKSGKSGKKAEKITKQFQKDQERINRSFDVMNNISNAEINAYSQDFKKLARALNQHTDTRLLGSAALSSIPDIGVAIIRQNFDGFVSDWFAPFARSILKMQKNKAQAINAQTARDWNFALATELGKRQKAMLNNDELLIPHSWWGKVAETITEPFGNVTGQNQLNDFVSNMAFSASVSKTMRIIDKKMTGKRVAKRDSKRNLAIGLSEANEKEIHSMWREAVGPSGGKDGTVYYADPGKWNINTPERAEAYEAFENATTRDFRQSRLQSTAGDRIPGTDTTMWRTVLKYKDYLVAAQNKLLLPIAGKVSARELDVVLTTGMMLSMGTMSYFLTSLAKDPTGESIDLSAGKLFQESLDRSSVLGIFMESINLFAKTGWLPFGETTRWQSRGLFGSVLGPTAGVVDDLLVTGGRIMQSIYGNREFSESDIKSIMRLLPYQNLFYLRYLNNQLAKSLAVSLGAKESRG